MRLSLPFKSGSVWWCNVDITWMLFGLECQLQALSFAGLHSNCLFTIIMRTRGITVLPLCVRLCVCVLSLCLLHFKFTWQNELTSLLFASFSRLQNRVKSFQSGDTALFTLIL